ncbi:MAG: lysophospholipid acyltransferase family protein [Gammaproteobacteria bacterium]
MSLLPGLLAYLPLPLLYLIADLLFLALFRGFGFQRRLAEENIAAAFPELSRDRVARLAADSARNAAHVVLETIKTERLDKTQLARRVRIENPELVDRLVEQHRTVVTLAAHHGNWEWLQLACSARLAAPVAALYKPLGRRSLDALLARLRSRFGSRLIPVHAALPELLRFAREPGVIALVADQGPRPDEEKHWGCLLGRDTAFFSGPEKLARLLAAPLLFAHMQRLRRGYYGVRFELLAQPPYTQPDGELMDRFIRVLDKQIREAPQDWVWVYKRWKYEKSVYAA